MDDTHSKSRSRGLERFARRAFTADVERIDPATRARLATARRQALDALRTDRSPAAWHVGPLRRAPTWAVAGLAATLVLALAAALWLGGSDVAPSGGYERVANGANDATSAGPAGSTDASDGEAVPPTVPAAPLTWPDDLELLAAGGTDVLDVLEEDLEFYAWLEQQPELAATEGRRR